MNSEIIITFIVAIAVVVVMAKLFFKSSVTIIKLILNSILGAMALWVFNLIFGKFFDFTIALNIVTASVTGVLGIPGLLLLIALKCFLPL